MSRKLIRKDVSFIGQHNRLLRRNIAKASLGRLLNIIRKKELELKRILPEGRKKHILKQIENLRRIAVLKEEKNYSIQAKAYYTE